MTEVFYNSSFSAKIMAESVSESEDLRDITEKRNPLNGIGGLISSIILITTAAILVVKCCRNRYVCFIKRIEMYEILKAKIPRKSIKNLVLESLFNHC